MNLSTKDFLAIWPALWLSAVILLVVVWDAVLKEPRHKRLGSYGGAVALLLLLTTSFVFPAQGSAFSGVYCADLWVLLLQRTVWLVGAIALIGGAERTHRVTPLRQVETTFLVLTSLLGMTLLFGARDLILLLVCFELMGIPLFVLAAMDKTDRPEREALATTEAAIKFFIVGVVSTPIALLGAGLFVGLSGSTDIAQIGQTNLEPINLLGLLFLLAGMGFKLGVVPFHMWVPDTYQASPTPFVAFLSTGPKLAAVAALSRIYVFGVPGARATWVPVMLVICIATLLVGNLAALPQSNTKRLLGYSSVSHVGYLLMGLLVVDSFGLETLLFYLVAYAITNLGTFLAVEAIEAGGGEGKVSDLNGLWQRSPWLAMSMLLFLLSLAGIPFVIGFWAKLYVFLAVWRAGYPSVVLIGALVAVVSLFYYLQLARSMYMTEPTQSGQLRVPVSLKLAVALCVCGVVGLGLYPRPLLETAHAAALDFLGER